VAKRNYICTRCETGMKSSLFFLFLKLVQINFIFTDNIRILYIYAYYWLLVRYKQKGQKQASLLAFHKCCQGCQFFVVRVTLVPVSYLSAPSAVHSYRVPGKFIRRLKSVAFPISGAKEKKFVGHPDRHTWQYCRSLWYFARSVRRSDEFQKHYYITKILLKVALKSTRPFRVFIFENMAGRVFIVPVTDSV
jgi:hypothetical protein